jgi:hypothetical protein
MADIDSFLRIFAPFRRFRFRALFSRTFSCIFVQNLKYLRKRVRAFFVSSYEYRYDLSCHPRRWNSAKLPGAGMCETMMRRSPPENIFTCRLVHFRTGYDSLAAFGTLRNVPHRTYGSISIRSIASQLYRTCIDYSYSIVSRVR